jgi:hypothetical protein
VLWTGLWFWSPPKQKPPELMGRDYFAPLRRELLYTDLVGV